MEPKYAPQIRQAFVNAFKQDWVMEDVDHEKAMNMMLAESGATMQKLSDDIEIGVKNGYSVEWQLDVMEAMLAKGMKG